MVSIVGLFQRMSPKQSRRGTSSPPSLKKRSTLFAERSLRKLSKTREMRSWTSRLGSLWTRPCSSRTSPVGSFSASSPRSALLRIPALIRDEMA
jgi:hypothetical protein